MSNTLHDIRSSLTSPDEEVRLIAVQKLRGQCLQDSGRLLLNAMGDESWRVRKEAVEIFVSSTPGNDQIDELLNLLRSEDNAGLRNSAVEAAVRIGMPAAQALIRRAQDDDPDVRKLIIDAMGFIQSNEFIPSLLKALGDEDVNVASAAAEHLGNLGDGRVVPDLLKAVAVNESDLFRFTALSAIGKLATPATVPEEIMRLTGNDLLRKSVYECLGSIADETAVPLLLEGIANAHKSSRNAAVMALFRIYSRGLTHTRQSIESSLQFFRGSDLVPLLIGSFDPQDPLLAEAVVVILDVMGDRRSVSTLLRAYGIERLSRQALKALKNLGAAGLNDLISHFGDADPVSRSAICTLIGECAYRNGSPVIRDALHDQSPLVRKAAVSSVGKLGLTDCIPEIVRLLDDSDQAVRSTVVSCLQALALIDRAGVQSVAHQLNDSEAPEQRHNAAILLAALGDGDRLSLLVKDEDARVRQAAVSSLGKLRLPSAGRILTIALVDENPEVRLAAAEALADVGDADTATALTLALNDDDSWVQCAALKSLAMVCPENLLGAVQSVFKQAEGLLLITCLRLLDQQGGGRAMELVEQALDSSDAEVVNLGLSIIGRHDLERIAPHAARLLKHGNWDVRMACAKTVAQLPAEKARPLLSQALAGENNDLVRTQLQNLLAGIA